MTPAIAPKVYNMPHYFISRQNVDAPWRVDVVYWHGGIPRGLPMLLRHWWMAWRECRRMNAERKGTQ